MSTHMYTNAHTQTHTHTHTHTRNGVKEAGAKWLKNCAR